MMRSERLGTTSRGTIRRRERHIARTFIMAQPTQSATPQATLLERTVDLQTGVRLAYVEQGDPAGVPVVFLHGITDSLRSFEPVLPHLPESIHALVLSQRGHGDSERPEADYRPRAFAADVAAFMAAKRIDKAIIAGHSMGTTIAQRFAIDFPERVIGLYLLGTVHRWRGTPALVELHAEAVGFTDPIDPEFAREFQWSTIVQPVAPAFVELAAQESLKLPARLWKAVTDDLMKDDFSDRLGEIQAPALLIWGDRDPLLPREDQEAILAAIPESRLIVYAGTGHAVHWEQPERVAADIVAYIHDFVAVPQPSHRD
jgi:non-heme chloroperoxidase